eukprot:6465802-Amphidinium_carterae.1
MQSECKRTLGEYPHHVINGLVPPPLRNILAQWVQRPWLQIKSEHSYVETGNQAKSLRITRGIRQGDCVSSFLFCIFFDVLLRHLHTFILGATTPLQFPHSWGLATGPTMCAQGDMPSHAMIVTLLAYADDVLIPMSADCPRKLISQVRRVMAFVRATFDSFRMRLNFARNKSEACVQLRSPLGKSVMQHLRNDAAALGEQPQVRKIDTGPGGVIHPVITFGSEFIRVVDCYQYLGRWTAAKVTACQDVAVHRAAATNSFAQHKRVLQSRRYSLHTRLYLFKALVRCHLLQNIASYAELPRKTLHSLCNTYVSLVKKVVMISPMDTVYHVPDDTLLRYVGEPTFQELADYRVATFIPKICSSSNPQVCTALSCIAQQSVWTSWLSSLTRIQQKCPDLATLPVPAAQTFHTWLAMILPAAAEWKLLARRTLVQCHPPKIDLHSNYTVISHKMLEPDGLLLLPIDLDVYPADENIEHVEMEEAPTHCCPICEKTFATHAGLSTHKMRQHTLIPPLALRVRTTSCTCCGAQMGTRSRLLGHLQGKLACALHVVANTEPMSLQEYFDNVGTLNKCNELLTRSRLPRTGPIPTINGQPESQSVVPVDPYE